jgi:hypothetical protein
LSSPSIGKFPFRFNNSRSSQPVGRNPKVTARRALSV